MWVIQIIIRGPSHIYCVISHVIFIKTTIFLSWEKVFLVTCTEQYPFFKKKKVRSKIKFTAARPLATCQILLRNP